MSVPDTATSDFDSHREEAEDMLAYRAGTLIDRYVAAMEALEWFASDDAWTVTPQSYEDGRHTFTAPPGSVYATPWGFAKGVLSSLPDTART